MINQHAVFDCNVFLQAMLSTRGAAHMCWQSALAGRTKLFISPYLLAEIRALPEHKKLRKFSRFTAEGVIERFTEGSFSMSQNWFLIPPQAFAYPRDPDDALYVDLALATNSLLIVSNDRDLLDLMKESNAEGKALRTRHPAFKVLTPPQFLAVIDSKDG